VPIQVVDSGGSVLQTSLGLNIGSGTAVTVNIGVGPFLGTMQLGSSTSFNLNPSGGTGPYTFSVPTTYPGTPGNALPPGCALSNIAVTCQAVAAGTYSFLVKAQDSAGNTGYKTLTVTFAQFTLYNTALPNAKKPGV